MSTCEEHVAVRAPWRRVLRVIAVLVPSSERDTWRREWDAELTFHASAAGTGAPTSRRWMAGRLAAALQHALWLRWQGVRLDTLLQDLRQAVRGLGRRPAFTVAALVTIALGIAGTTLIFSVGRAVFWRPLPYPRQAELVMLSSATPAAPDLASANSVSPPDFVDWRRDSALLADAAAIRDDSYALTTGGPAEQVSAASVTGGFFAILGIQPEAGRVIVESDTEMSARDVAVLSHGLWLRRFGGDRSAIGQTITLDGVPREIIGVMPREVDYPLDTTVWTPLRFSQADLTTQRGAHYLTVIARMKPGAKLEAVKAELSGMAARLAASNPRTNRNARISAVTLRRAIVGEDLDPPMRLFFGAVAVVFLIACVNVASLLIGLGFDRAPDVALRAALGASRGRLVRAMFIESLALASAGGLIGAGLAAFGARALAAQSAIAIPFLDETRLDGSTLAFTAAMVVMAAVLFGILPAWQASRKGNGSLLMAGGSRTTSDRARMRTRGILVAAEIGLAVALLVGAGLLGRSLMALMRVDLGFKPDHVQTFSFSLPDPPGYPLERRSPFVDDVLARVRAMGPVTSAGAVFGLPLSDFSYYISLYQLDGVPVPDDSRLSVEVRIATPDYFKTMSTPVRGREFTAADRAGTTPVVIVNALAARLLWPKADAIGRHVIIGTRLGGGNRVGGEVIGIAADTHDVGPAQRPRPTLYAAHAQFPTGFVTVVARTREEIADSTSAFRSIVGSLDPSVPVFRIRSMNEYASRAVAQPRLYLELLVLFAVTAIGLAAVGVYGVMAQTVGARTREIGIRLALGATPRAVVSLVAGHAGLLGVAGVAGGLLLALLSRTLLSKVLFGVEPLDAVTYVTVSVATGLVALLASWIPARRAARIDPVSTLRAD